MEFKRKNNQIYTNLKANDSEVTWRDEVEGSLSSDSEYSESSCDYTRNFEWDTHINNDGFLFYIRFDLMCQPKSVNFDDDVFFRNEYKRLSIRKNENILSKLTGKNSKHNWFKVKIIDSVKKEQLTGVTKEIMISIAPKKNINPKEIYPLSDSILGITTSLFPDGRRLMIDKIKEYSVFNKDKHVKPKDWIKSIDVEAVNVDNFEGILEGFIKIPTIMKVTFYESVEQDMHNSFEIKITNIYDLIQNGDTIFNRDENTTFVSNDLVFSMIYISKEYTLNDELDVKFCYPSREENILFNSRGSFVTLHSIIQSTFTANTLMTSLKVRNTSKYINIKIYY